MAKRENSIITTEVVGETIVFRVKGAGELRLELGRVNPACATHAMHHGFIQRVSDKAALSRNPDNGQPASPVDKLEAMRVIVDHYNSGSAEWSTRQAGGSGAGGEGGLTLRAVAMVQGVSPEEMRARLEVVAEKRQTTVRALLAKLAGQADVAAKMAELRGPAASVNPDDLLGELAGM